MRNLFLSWLVTLSLFSGLAMAAAPKFSKVMTVIFENENQENIASLPFFAKLATEGASLENFHGLAHPSQSNYIALISGSTNGCTSDANINISAANITNLLEKKNLTWKVYAEGYPGNCYLGARTGKYARKHVPFLSFKSIQNDSTKCGNIVDASALEADVANGTLPDYAFYVPDLNNDGHDTSGEFADKWFAKTFGPLIADPKFMNGMLLISTFDESLTSEPTNHIYTSFYGAGVKAGSTSSTKYTHYDLLRTIEDAFGLGTMASKDAAAKAITGIWQ